MSGFILLMLACSGPKPADQLFVGGTIALDATQTTTALAVIDGVVVSTGDDALDHQTDATQIIDLTDQFAIPGFHDAHAHVLPGSFVMDRLLMVGASSMSTILGAVEDYASGAPEEPWIVGYGWILSFADEVDGRDLDAIVSDRPVLLVESSGHAALVNSTAMARVGIDANTPDPEGGEIVRDENGEPTGLLLEEALSLVSEIALADYSDEDFLDGLTGTLNTLVDSGVTSVSEIMASPGFDLARPWIYADLEERGELPVRVYYYVPIFSVDGVEAAAQWRDQYDGEMLNFAGAKVWVDGSMGTTEAWVSEPLENDPHNFGSHYFNTADLEAVIQEAEALSMSLKFHVNGDAAVTATLDALESVAAREGLSQSHVLDHVVLISDQDRLRMAELGIVASVQPSHALVASFGDTPEAWGDERFADAYDYQSMVEDGIQLAMGTDWPVWPNLHAPTNLWAALSIEETHSISREDAFSAYTVGGAEAIGQDGTLGCLDIGCQADIVVLSDNLFEVDANEIPDLDVRAVYISGNQIK